MRNNMQDFDFITDFQQTSMSPIKKKSKRIGQTYQTSYNNEEEEEEEEDDSFSREKYENH